MSEVYDVMAIGAHPDDIEVVMGGTAHKLSASGRRIVFVDLCDGDRRWQRSPDVSLTPFTVAYRGLTG